MLPATLPSTFHEDCSDYSASISYELEAELTCLDLSGTHMEAAQVVVLREMLQEGVAPKQGEMTAEVVNCCCMSKGFSNIFTSFEKNAYVPGETANMITEIDNSRC